ncbi:hypothetical protein Droror1_Dr00000467 [Drosera rotundifolia]
MVGTTIPITTTQVKAKWASKLSLTKESIGFGNGGGASGPCNSGGVRQDWGMVGGRGWGAGGFGVGVGVRASSFVVVTESFPFVEATQLFPFVVVNMICLKVAATIVNYLEAAAAIVIYL